ncbi:TPA: glycosyltransferase family 9 protein [Candidatus Spyradomonas excrementavium]|nr:glycosyltransferase family 9 protein [Candidatus Spyradomonas excrementavium]
MGKKILVIRSGAIGDVVHSSIIQSAIKAQHPDSVVHFMTSAMIAPIIERDVNLERVFAFDMSKKDDFSYLFKLGLELRKEKYDAVISLQNSLRNRFLGLMAGGKYLPRLSKGAKHATDAFFASAKAVFPDLKKPDELKLYLDEGILERVKALTDGFPRPFFIISPAGENDKFRKGRIWRFERWSELSNRLIDRCGGTVFVVGSKPEGELHRKHLNIKNSRIFSGELSLEESIHLFSLADLFISGDSGPLHIASALGVKTLGIYGSTSPVFCAPYGKNGHVFQTPFECNSCDSKTCKKLNDGETYTPCMDAIAPEVVFEFIVKNNLFS